MPIRYVSPPEQSLQIARTSLQNMGKFARDARVADMMALRADELELAVPHAVYHVGLDHLAARRPLGELTLTGWRHLVQRDDRVLASTEVTTDDAGRSTGFDQINFGPYVQATERALADLAAMEEVLTGSFELHMLRIPALYAVVLRLAQPDTGRDLFVPLAPAPDFLEAGRIYLENEILDVLEGPARVRLDFDDSSDQPYGMG